VRLTLQLIRYPISAATAPIDTQVRLPESAAFRSRFSSRRPLAFPVFAFLGVLSHSRCSHFSASYRRSGVFTVCYQPFLPAAGPVFIQLTPGLISQSPRFTRSTPGRISRFFLGVLSAFRRCHSMLPTLSVRCWSSFHPTDAGVHLPESSFYAFYTRSSRRPLVFPVFAFLGILSAFRRFHSMLPTLSVRCWSSFHPTDAGVQLPESPFYAFYTRLHLGVLSAFSHHASQQSRLLPLYSAMPPINKRSANPDGLDAGPMGRGKTRRQQKLIRW
jgi:hypothetical protein